MKKKNTVEKERPKRPFWGTLLPYMKSHKRNVITAIVFSMVTGLCVALQPFVITYIIDCGILQSPSLKFLFWEIPLNNLSTATDSRIKLVLVLCGAYLVFSAVRMICWAIGLHSMVRALEGTLFNLRSKFFGHVQNMCMRFYDRNSSGELYNYIMGSPMANIKGYLNNVIMSVPYQAVAFVISLAMLISYNWQLTLVTVATALIMALLYRMAQKKIRRTSRAYLDAESEASKYIADVLHGSEAVKMYSIEENTITRFQQVINNLRNKGVSHTMATVLEHMKPEFTQYVGIAFVYALGGILCIMAQEQGANNFFRSTLTAGQLTAFVASMGTILGTLSNWLNIALQKHSAQVALDRVQDIIEEASDTPEVAEDFRRSLEIEKQSAIRNDRPCIAFRDVSFAYADKRIFEHLSCRIGYNESIGLVGGSGSGKSTFTKLIMRLYDVQEGSVNLHGRDVKTYPTHELRRSFGVVPQNPFIFYGTIWDNIRIAHPTATNKEIIDAMEVARVHEFVNDLPMGWSTVIGDGALGLSGGQKQRIAIARAVLKQPDIFIFDEATSALDNISERLIQEAIEELMKTHTFIIVAHRLSTIRNANRILVFDHGKVVQEGSYNQLAEEEGHFKDLLDASMGMAESAGV